MKARRWRLRSTDSVDRLRVFALAWLLMPLAFFSFSGSKLPGYILPVLPAAALIAGERLTKFLCGDRDGFWAMRITGALFGMFAIVGSVYVVRYDSLSFKCVAMIGVPLTVTAATCIFWTHRRTVSALLVVFATFAALIVALNCGVASFATRESMRDLIQLANARGYGSAPVYALHQIDRSAEFYAAGRVVYAADGEPVRFESALDILEAARNEPRPDTGDRAHRIHLSVNGITVCSNRCDWEQWKTRVGWPLRVNDPVHFHHFSFLIWPFLNPISWCFV